MSRWNRGEISTAVIFTLATTTILGLAGIVYKELVNKLDTTATVVILHDKEIALQKQMLEPLPKKIENIEESVNLMLKNQAIMGAVQGIKLATTTP
jgi:predicted PurR-regulated permease PerM